LHFGTEQYNYYKLKNTVSIPRRNSNTATIIQTCLDRNNWERVSVHDAMEQLAQTLSGYYVYMVIQPKGELPAYLLIIGASLTRIPLVALKSKYVDIFYEQNDIK